MIPAWIIEELRKAEEEKKKKEEEDRPRLYIEESIEEPYEKQKEEDHPGYGLHPNRF